MAVKLLHRNDLFGWSVFNEDRNIDFHSVIWVRQDGNVVIDPLPQSAHDRAHLQALGGVATIIITNSDHVRDAARLASEYGARILGPAAERERFPVACNGWLADGDEPVPGLRALTVDGSKTPGELTLLLEGTTLITGDLIRAHQAGALCLLPEPKLGDKQAAAASIKRLAAIPEIDSVLVGDGWPIFRAGHEALCSLAATL